MSSGVTPPGPERPLHLLVEDLGAGADALPQIEAAAARVLAGWADWRATPLFENGERALDRFYEVTVGLSGTPSVRASWTLAHALNDEIGADDWIVTADLPSTVYEPAGARGLDPAPHDPLPASGPLDWPLTSTRAREAWARADADGREAGGEGVRVGQPDTGYHDPQANIGSGALDLGADFDFVDDDANAEDPLERGHFPERLNPGHGTRTASAIGGRPPAAILGVAPAATIVPIRAVKSVAQFFDGDVAKAVRHASERARCDVVSMSLGGVAFRGLEAAIRAAVADGVLVLAAAGNWDWAGDIALPLRLVVWPAAYAECIAVGASNADDRPWAFSAQGTKVLVSAPGEDVWAPAVTEPRPPRQTSGTSYGVAHTAGAAALWLAYHGAAELRERYGGRLQTVFSTVLAEAGVRTPPGWPTTRLGAGIVDADALLAAELPAADALDAAPPEAPLTSYEDALLQSLEADGTSGGDAAAEPPLAAGPRGLREGLAAELLYLTTEYVALRHAVLERDALRDASTLADPLAVALADVASPQLLAAVPLAR